MYRIFLHTFGFVDEGWWGGSNSRSNTPIWDRTPNKDEANKLDEKAAVEFYQEFVKLGYSCKIVPSIPKDRMLEILLGE